MSVLPQLHAAIDLPTQTQPCAHLLAQTDRAAVAHIFFGDVLYVDDDVGHRLISKS